MKNLSQFLGSAQVSHPLTYGNLTVFPVFRPDPGPADYVSLSQALQRRQVSIRETSDGGTVPFVRVENKGTDPVLLLDGEELVGAKQNRILNLTILVAAKTTTNIPVTCVEAGRWGVGRHPAHRPRRRTYNRPRSSDPAEPRVSRPEIARSERPARDPREFEDSESIAYARLRAEKMYAVGGNLRNHGSRAGNQGESWSDIRRKSGRLKTHSPTGAMSDIYESQRPVLQQYVESFRPVTGQTGAIFALFGELAGLEVFGSEGIVREIYPKLVRSYALDAIENRPASDRLLKRTDGTEFLEAVRKIAPVEEFEAIGLGHDLRFANDTLVGAALRRDDSLVHLSVLQNGDPRQQAA